MTEDAPFAVTGGVEFRGELTDDDRRRASRLGARGAWFQSPWLALAILAFPLVLPLLFGVAFGIVGLLAVAMVCFSLIAAWSRSRWQLAVQLDLPPGPFQGRASPLGLHYESPTWIVNCPWSDVAGYHCNGDFVVLYVEARPIAIPRAALTEERFWAQLCEFVLRSKVRPLG